MADRKLTEDHKKKIGIGRKAAWSRRKKFSSARYERKIQTMFFDMAFGGLSLRDKLTVLKIKQRLWK